MKRSAYIPPERPQFPIIILFMPELLNYIVSHY